MLPMNTGAEAVESGIKVARKWGHDVRGIENPSIVVAAGNFHGRTISIISFSDDPDARAGFGPYTPGFRIVPYGDVAAVEAACDESTVAVLVEPIQGEGGVVIPPADYLPGLRRCATDGGCCWSATRSSRDSGGPARPSRRSTSASSLTSTCWARRWAAGWSRCRQWSATPTSSACCIRVSTARPSGATRWPRPSV